MKLRTHEERMAALEAAYDKTDNAIERATVVECAARLVRIEEESTRIEVQRQMIEKGDVQAFNPKVSFLGKWES